jgi:hypothetical protein
LRLTLQGTRFFPEYSLLLGQRRTMDVTKINAELKKQRRTVAFDTYDITAKQLLDMVAEGQIKVAPDYQRHFVWKADRESALIESVFLGIPVPSLFMATNEDSSWECIDGLQRITTLINFVKPQFRDGVRDISTHELTIGGLEKLPSLNGLRYADLPETLKLNFLTRPIRITVLNDLSDYQVRFDLFERLNTGGIILHQQEIRNCVFQGEFNDFIKACAADVRLESVFKKSNREGRGNMEEIVLKFFAYFEKRDAFKHSVKEFLNDYMEAKTKSFTNKKSLLEIYDKTMEVLVRALPGGVVRSDRPNTTPLLLFEAVAIGVADVMSAGGTVNDEVLRAVLDNSELKRVTMGGTNSNPKLLERIRIVREAVAS